jgi:hypothetical protein
VLTGSLSLLVAQMAGYIYLVAQTGKLCVLPLIELKGQPIAGSKQ